MGFYIGNVRIEGNVFLGPMAGVSDLPFRLLCKEKGADLVYTEMISAKGILYQNKNTKTLMKIAEEERPVALQLFGSDPEILSEMAKKIEHLNFDILDINMGCPVPKVVNNNEGSALMKDPELIGRIVNKVSRAIKKPVTIKIRKGFYPDCDNAAETAKIAEENGAAAIAVHARTRDQFYSGRADLWTIQKVKESVSIPVIGSGDVFSPEDALRMLAQTGCDAVMVARGARGNPWIFSQIKSLQKDGIIPPKPDFPEIRDMIFKHTQLAIEFKGEYTGIREMRKHIAWYTAGLPASSKLRSRAGKIESKEDLIRLLEDYREYIEKQPNKESIRTFY